MAESLPFDPKFYDIDNRDGFESCYSKIKEALTTNFIVDFGPTEARCATNLDHVSFTRLLDQPRSASMATQWINFWGGDGQRDAIKKIASHYGISPRLVNLLYPKQLNAISLKISPTKKSELDGSLSSASDVRSVVGVDDAEDNLPLSTLATNGFTSTGRSCRTRAPGPLGPSGLILSGTCSHAEAKAP